MSIQRFEDIEAWQMGRDLARRIYRAAKQPDFAKDWSLKDQIIRAVSSVMHNIAEGFDGGSNAEFIRFLGYSYRSCTEVQSQLYIALDQDYVTREEFGELYELVGATRAKIGAFIKYLRQSNR